MSAEIDVKALNVLPVSDLALLTIFELQFNLARHTEVIRHPLIIYQIYSLFLKRINDLYLVSDASIFCRYEPHFSNKIPFAVLKGKISRLCNKPSLYLGSSSFTEMSFGKSSWKFSKRGSGILF